MGKSKMRYQSFQLTPILTIIILNLLIYIATLILPELVLFLGLRPIALLERPWTMTNLFVHSGLWHILANMLTLYFFGSYLSRIIGDRRFLIIYFVGGILGNIFYLILGNPFAIAIGASGAVFALGGALAVMRPRIRVIVFPIPAPIPLWIAVIGGFLILSFLPHVGWQAHLGGLVFGLVAGYFFKKRQRYIIW
jgi:membrane associated rhomboid family serine protease